MVYMYRFAFRRPHRHALRATMLGSGILTLALLGLPSSSDAASSGDHVVVGYLAQWDNWKGPDAGVEAKGVLNHLNVAMENYDIINWSFFGLAYDGSMHSGDLRNKDIYQTGAVQQPGSLLHPDVYSSWDFYLLEGEIEPVHYVGESDEKLKERIAEQGIVYTNVPPKWEHVASRTSGSYPIPVKKAGGAPGVIEYAHQHGTKVMASIGGWSMCKHFPEVARDQVKRARFVEDCQRLIDMGFDGIDLDWEYPGSYGMNIENNGPDDYDNFLTLVKEIRQAIGPDKLITSAFSASISKLDSFDWVELDKYMDYYNMMTYDYAGGWSERTGHNSALYDYDSSAEKTFNYESLYQWMVVEQRIPAHKINMGVAFYGRSVQTGPSPGLDVPTSKRQVVADPDGPVSSALDDAHFKAYGGTPYYYIIEQAKKNGWTDHWDDQAKVPYLTKEEAQGGFFLSYDNERSIKLKGEYIREKGLGGAIVWTAQGEIECVGGYEDAKMPICHGLNPRLSNALNDGLSGSGSAPQAGPPIKTSSTTPAIQISISFDSVDTGSVSATIPSSSSATGTNIAKNPTGSASNVASSGDSKPAQGGPAPVAPIIPPSSGADGSAASSCAGLNVYPNWTAKSWPGGEPDHANDGDVMVYDGKAYMANWWTNSLPGSDKLSWTFLRECS